jgi:hypothetical protein
VTFSLTFNIGFLLDYDTGYRRQKMSVRWLNRLCLAVAVPVLIACILVLDTGDCVNVEKVLAEALRLTSRSWEAGALAEALLELRNPQLSVFSDEPFHNGTIPCHAVNGDVQALKFAKQYIWINDTDTLTDGEGEQGEENLIDLK